MTITVQSRPSRSTAKSRLHSGLGYKTPLEVTTEYQQNQLIAA